MHTYQFVRMYRYHGDSRDISISRNKNLQVGDIFYSFWNGEEFYFGKEISDLPIEAIKFITKQHREKRFN